MEEAVISYTIPPFSTYFASSTSVSSASSSSLLQRLANTQLYALLMVLDAVNGEKCMQQRGAVKEREGSVSDPVGFKEIVRCLLAHDRFVKSTSSSHP